MPDERRAIIRQLLTLPNILTIFRLVSAPAFLLLFFGDFFSPHDQRLRLGLCLLLVAASEASDVLDGYFARKYGQVSDFGKLMDPYADSAFRLTVLFSFSSRVASRETGDPWIPLWTVVVLFYRDLLTSVLRTFAMKRGVVIAARTSGKVKAVVEAAGIIAILVLALKHEFMAIPHELIPALMKAPAYWIMMVVIAVAVWSGLDYFWACRKHMLPHPEAEEPGNRAP
ncbi:MAG TPA: CDP-diacylglycerol--glycerol-3-phosphate 3-phosphatidyltransferase [Planctomycetota bacterium]|nr:CDP-diacylglycerol--glycerol-3-phosphate 3-phosphatidyltransferase [Planctomycetota bacterium]